MSNLGRLRSIPSLAISWLALYHKTRYIKLHMSQSQAYSKNTRLHLGTLTTNLDAIFIIKMASKFVAKVARCSLVLYNRQAICDFLLMSRI